jgi:putative ABC transport system permease protein
MIKNYLILAVKNIRKQKLFSLINILGLTIGIACCFMIFLFVINEFSYDSFHKKGKDIYRVMRVGKLNNELMDIPYLSPPYSTALVTDYPKEVLQAVRIMPDNDLISYRNIAYNERSIYLADSNFFQLFDFPLLRGNPLTVLKEPRSIVLTAKTAKKYFGNEDPIGKVVEFNKDLRLQVTGIAQDVPVNSHLNFDMVVPIMNFSKSGWFNQWPSNSLFVYIQLAPSAKPEQLIARFPHFMDKYLGKYYAESGYKMDLTIRPLKGIYFETASPFDNVKHGNKKMVYIFISVAILILVIACINFINLATARATDRSREVGLRKVMGAIRRQLIGQFILESILFATTASLLAMGAVFLLMPLYDQLLGYQLPPIWGNPWVYLFLLAVVIIVGFLAGSYPALMLSSFTPIESLKGKFRVGKTGAFFRKTLVVFQFGISVLLIISITIIINQMNYVRNTDLGFHKEQSMVVRLDNAQISDQRIRFKKGIEQVPDVQSVSLMSGEPGGFHDQYTFEAESRPGLKVLLNTEFSDFEFVRTLGLKIIAGRDFSSQFRTDTLESVLVNRTGARFLGYTPEQAVGKWIRNVQKDSLKRKIIGVVEDYHYVSLKEPIGPLVIAPNEDRRLALIRLKTSHLQSTIQEIKRNYDLAAPYYPFEYIFLDDEFNQLYQSESRQQSILTVFSMIAIFIACLGLFGLASYTAIKRTKEIGVRKVLGSSISNIVLLLTKDLLRPVLLGTLIAIPLGYYFMSRWLQDFVYHIQFHWWMFALAAALALSIALVTVSLQAIKAAVADPVKSLRSE